MSEHETERYWGIYCSQHDVWQRRPDGSLYFYPAREIAEAHIADDLRTLPTLYGNALRFHDYEATEFGKQVHSLPTDGKGCPGNS